MSNNLGSRKRLYKLLDYNYTILLSIILIFYAGCSDRKESNPAKEIQSLINKAEEIVHSFKKPNAKKDLSETLNKIASYKEQALSILLKELEGASQKDARRYVIISSLSHIETEESKRVLIRSKDDKNAKIRAITAFSLGDYNSKKSYDALIQLASKDTSIDVRTLAILSLGRLGKIEAVEFLKTQLNDPNPTIRDATQEALDRIQEQQSPVK